MPPIRDCWKTSSPVRLADSSFPSPCFRRNSCPLALKFANYSIKEKVRCKLGITVTYLFFLIFELFSTIYRHIASVYDNVLLANAFVSF